MAKALSKKEQREARRAAARRAKIRNRAIFGVAGLAVVVLLAVAVVSGTPSGNTDPTAWDLPAMGPTADQQERVALVDYRGTPTVVNFFASWCTACDAELPGFANVSRDLQGQVAFVGIASQETGNPMFMPERHGIDWWPLARDIGGGTGSGLSTALGARGMPLTAFYGPDGTLLHIQLGAISETQLRDTIRTLFGV